jgi:hypothetical protein
LKRWDKGTGFALEDVADTPERVKRHVLSAQLDVGD